MKWSGSSVAAGAQGDADDILTFVKARGTFIKLSNFPQRVEHAMIFSVLVIDEVLDGRDITIGHAPLLPFLKVCHRYAVSTRIFREAEISSRGAV